MANVGKDKWGTKRQCYECDSKFYDMNKALPICPNCESVYEPKTAKVIAAKAVAAAAASARAPAPKVIATLPPDDDAAVDAKAAPKDATDLDGEDVLDATTDDDDDEVAGADLIEDASELGEDEDDMAEVLDGAPDKKEAQP